MHLELVIKKQHCVIDVGRNLVQMCRPADERCLAVWAQGARPRDRRAPSGTPRRKALRRSMPATSPGRNLVAGADVATGLCRHSRRSPTSGDGGEAEGTERRADGIDIFSSVIYLGHSLFSIGLIYN